MNYDFKGLLGELLATEFPEKKIVSITGIANALTTHAFRVKFEDIDVIAKIAYDHEDIADGKGDKEQKVLSLLQTQSPQLLTPKVWKYYKEYPGFPGYVIFLEVLKGDVLSAEEINTIGTTPANLEALTADIAEIHKIKANEVTDFAKFKAPSIGEYLEKYVNKFEKGFGEIPEHKDFSKFIQKIRLIQEYYKGENAYQLVHKDINFKNILFDHGQYSGIIDWEGALTAPISFEFAHVAVLAPIYGVSEWHYKVIETYLNNYAPEPVKLKKEIEMVKLFTSIRYFYRIFGHASSAKDKKSAESGETKIDYFVRIINEWKFPF